MLIAKLLDSVYEKVGGGPKNESDLQQSYGSLIERARADIRMAATDEARFDVVRNLIQGAELAAGPAADAKWWVLALKLHRRSGPPYLWQRGAKVFVNMLCKHLLRWRAATDQQEADCLERSGDIFPPQG